MCTVKNFFYQDRGLAFVPAPGKEPPNSWDFPCDHSVIVIYREPPGSHWIIYTNQQIVARANHVMRRQGREHIRAMIQSSVLCNEASPTTDAEACPGFLGWQSCSGHPTLMKIGGRVLEDREASHQEPSDFSHLFLWLVLISILL